MIKRDIKGYIYDFSFVEKEIEKQLKKDVIWYELLYKATKDGDKSENFHSKWDNKENTLIIIKSNTGKTFGGFTTQLWKHTGNYKNDKFAFAFSFDNKKIYSILDNKIGSLLYFQTVYMGLALDRELTLEFIADVLERILIGALIKILIILTMKTWMEALISKF